MLRKFKSRTQPKDRTAEKDRDDRRNREKGRRVRGEADDYHDHHHRAAGQDREKEQAKHEDRRMSMSSLVSNNTKAGDSNEKISRRSSIRIPHSATSATFSIGNSNGNSNSGNGNGNGYSNSPENGYALKKGNSYLASSSEGANALSRSAVSSKDEAAHKRGLNVVPQTFSAEEARNLKFHVTNSLNPQMPFGDGSEKLFGIENFGYICYVSSIFQCLYHTPQFRKAILEYPPRASPIERRRKFTVPGKEVGKVPHALTPQPNSMNQQNYTNRAGSSSPVIPATPNSQGSSANLSSTSSGMRKLSLFSRSNLDSSSSVLSSIDNSDGAENGGNDTNAIYSQSDFTVSDTHKDTQLEKALTEKYPALKDIETNYFLNSQKNLTLVGVIDEPSASLEWRKKASLIRGPIINLDEPFLKEYGMKEENMFTVIKDAFECITENASKTGVLSPYNLIDVIKRENILFRNAQHQDAHEFLNFLINNVLESMKQYNKESIITDIFEGELTSETKCLTCDNSSYRNEKFLDLSIDLEPDSSITNCLKMFSKIEMLNENNKFYCENCYSYQEAAKSIKLRKIPKILAFHLKRFKYSEKLDRLVKLFYRVEYVKTLRICNTTKDSEQPDKLYELYGVVVHIGGGPYHGHYVSLVKTELYGWLLFDDETIEKIDEDYVFKFFGDGCGLATAYLLFYREVDDEKKFFEDQLYNGLDSECDDADHNSAHTADRGYSLSERNNDSSNSNSDEHKGVINHRFTFKKPTISTATSSSASSSPPDATFFEAEEPSNPIANDPTMLAAPSSHTATATPLTTPVVYPETRLPQRQTSEIAPLKYTVNSSQDQVDEFDPFSQADYGDVSSSGYGGDHISKVTTKSTMDTAGTTGTATNDTPKASQRRRSSLFRGLTNDSHNTVAGSHSISVSTSEYTNTGSRRSSIFGFRKKSAN